jgi:BolA protein
MGGPGRPGGTAERQDRIEAGLRDAFAPVYLDVVDESELHRGHAGAAAGGGHFRVRLASARFEGRSRMERHRLVYSALGDLMGSEIHALTLELWTPHEWAARSS